MGGRRRLSLGLGLAALAIVLLGLVVAQSETGRRAPTLSAHSRNRRTTAAAHHRTLALSTTDPHEGLAPLDPTVAAPLRVLEIGDSLGIDLGDQFQAQLDAQTTADTVVGSVGDSGLSNEAFYNWPVQLATMLATDRPQVVVVFIGANDDQGMLVDGTAAEPGTPMWSAAYAERVDEILTEATGAGARVVWVGMPPMENADLNEAMQIEDTIYAHETARFPGTLYVSSTAVLGGPSGSYENTTQGSAGPAVVRTPDGVHLTPAGAGLLAATVIAAIDNQWHLSLAKAPAGTPGPGIGP
jgi:uncharacterized protein